MEKSAQDILAEDPGNPFFADYAEQCRGASRFAEAVSVCLKGLSANPSCHTGRLVLARVLFENDCVPYAVEELEKLRIALPDNKFIPRLLDKIAPAETHAAVPAAAAGAAETVAETEFSFEDIELLEEDSPAKDEVEEH